LEQHRYIYDGRVSLAGPVATEQQPGEDGVPRTVFVFPLKLVTAEQPATPTIHQIERIRQDRQRRLKTKSTEDLKRLAVASGRTHPGHRTVSAVQCDRSEFVVAYVKRAANGICGLCVGVAPFVATDGPYLECHHVKHLAHGGPDTIDNAIALCPNCHRKMHVLDLKRDRLLLQEPTSLRPNKITGARLLSAVLIGSSQTRGGGISAAIVVFRAGCYSALLISCPSCAIRRMVRKSDLDAFYAVAR
jgi:5-methylcytosine-specific restriction protein A